MQNSNASHFRVIATGFTLDGAHCVMVDNHYVFPGCPIPLSLKTIHNGFDRDIIALDITVLLYVKQLDEFVVRSSDTYLVQQREGETFYSKIIDTIKKAVDENC